MIDLNKKYKTKGGLEVRLFMIDGNRVLGAYKEDSGKWCQWSWQPETGVSFLGYASKLDLVEVVEPINTVVYCRVYSDKTSYTSCVRPLPISQNGLEKVYKKTITFTEDDLVED